MSLPLADDASFSISAPSGLRTTTAPCRDSVIFMLQRSRVANCGLRVKATLRRATHNSQLATFLLSCSRRHRQGQRERAALVELRFDADVAAVQADDLTGDRQAEAG